MTFFRIHKAQIAAYGDSVFQLIRGYPIKKTASLVALLVGIGLAVSAQAATATGAPDMINASLGYYDFDKDGSRGNADYRLEYEWGASILPMLNRDWASLDRYAMVHPIVGFEGTGDFMTYFNGGFGVDAPIGTHVVFSWDEAIGLYGHGDSNQSLGSPLEVRSQLELGWRFDNNVRLSTYISHMSNLGAGDKNPGAETLGGYLHIPVSMLSH